MRGGQLFVVPKLGLPESSSGVLVSHHTASPVTTVSDLMAADYLSHAVGVAPRHVAESAPLLAPELTAFSKANAAVVIALDGVGRHLAASLPSLSRRAALAAALRPAALLVDSASVLATLVSGNSPNVHGVPAAQWRDSLGVEHSPATDAARGASLASRLPTQSFSVSVSGSRVLSTSACAGAKECVTWQDVSAAAHHPSSFVQFVAGNIKGKKSFPLVSQLPGAHQLSANGLLELPFGKSVFSFDAGHSIDAQFLQELELTLQLAAFVQSKPGFARDAAADVFTVALSSLAPLLQQLGVKSERFQAALHAVDVAVSRLLDALEHVYGAGRVAWLAALLDESAPLDAGERALASVTRELQAARVSVYGLELYVAQPNTPDYVCSSLNRHIWSQGLVAVCPTEEASPVARAMRAGVTPLIISTSSSSDGITWMNVVAFQLVLWIALILFFAALGGVTLIGDVDIPSESPLIRNLPDIYRQQGTAVMRELE